MSTLRWVGVPSSSMVSEPRRASIAPSSITVTPAAATRSPMRPEKAEVPLRLKSPSRPWPMASWSSTPGQPGPSTTGISPAGAATDSKFTSDWAKAMSIARFHSAGSNIVPNKAVGPNDLDHAPAAGNRHADLRHSGIAGAGGGVDLLAQRDLGGE